MALLFLTIFIPLCHLAFGGGTATPTGPGGCTPTGEEPCEATATANHTPTGEKTREATGLTNCTPSGEELREATGPASYTSTAAQLRESDQFLTGLDTFFLSALSISHEISALTEKGPAFWSTIQDETRKQMERLSELSSSVWETTGYPVLRDRTELEYYFSKVSKQKKELRELERQFRRNKEGLLKQLQQRDATLRELPASILLNMFLIAGKVRVVTQFTDSIIEHLKGQGGKNVKIVTEEKLTVRRELFRFASTAYRLEGLMGGLAALAHSKHPADKSINSATHEVELLQGEIISIIKKLTWELKEDWTALLAEEKHRPKLFNALGPAVLLPEIAASLKKIAGSVDAEEFPLNFSQVYENFLKITASAIEIDAIPVFTSPHPASLTSAELSAKEEAEVSTIRRSLDDVETRLAVSIGISGRRLPDDFRQMDYPLVSSHSAETTEVMAQALSLLQKARPWYLSGFLTDSPAVRLARWVNAMYVLNHPTLCSSTAEKLTKITGTYNSPPQANATPYAARLLELGNELQCSYLKSVSLINCLRSHFYLLSPGVTCDKCTRAAAAVSQTLPSWHLSVRTIAELTAQLEVYRGEPLGEVIEVKQIVKDFYRSIVEVEEAAIHAMASIWGSNDLVPQLECFIRLFSQVQRMMDMVDMASLVVRGVVDVEERSRPLIPPLPQEYQLFRNLAIA